MCILFRLRRVDFGEGRREEMGEKGREGGRVERDDVM